MKIVFFSDVFPPKIDGVVSHLVSTASALKKRGQRIMAVAPLTFKRRKFSPLPFEALIFLPSFPAFVYPEIRLALPYLPLRRLRRFRPDILHFHTPAGVGFSALALGKILKVPVVGTFHTYLMSREYLDIVHLGRLEPKLSRLVWNYNNFYYNRADVVVSPSESVRRDLLAHGLKRRVVVVPNGVDLTEFSRINKEAAKEIKSKFYLGNKVVLYVGRLSKEKSLDVLLAALRLVVNDLPEAQLLLVGDGPERKRLQEEVKREGLGGKVIFTGAIPHERLPATGVYEASSLFATASKSENQPLSVIEALAKGLPVVGVSSRGMPELVSGNGLLGAPDDVRGMAANIRLLLTDRKLGQELSRAALKKVRGYAIENTAEKLLSLYQSLKTSKGAAVQG